MNLKHTIREIPDYPEKGINFKDITTLLKDPIALNHVLNFIKSEFGGCGITKVVALEARGFIFGGAIAHALNAGFVPVRKAGKLPSDVVREEYQLEYGTDIIEMHVDALCENDIVLIHDDVLATGGTAAAALSLINKLNVKKIYFSFICDLSFITNQQKQKIYDFKPQILVSY